jgi:hypothetical protein
MKRDLFFQSIKASKEIRKGDLHKEGKALLKMQPQNQERSLLLQVWEV